MPRLHTRAVTDGQETTKLLPIPEVVWQQPQETQLIDMKKNSTIIMKRKNDVESETFPIRETPPQVCGSDTESLLENQTSSMPVQFPNDSRKQQLEIQRYETDMSTNDSGDDISPPKKITSQIEKQFVRDDITNEF